MASEHAPTCSTALCSAVRGLVEGRGHIPHATSYHGGDVIVWIPRPSKGRLDQAPSCSWFVLCEKTRQLTLRGSPNSGLTTPGQVPTTACAFPANSVTALAHCNPGSAP